MNISRYSETLNGAGTADCFFWATLILILFFSLFLRFWAVH